MGVIEEVRETAGSIAGAGASMLISGGKGAAKLLRDTWNGPPIRIPRVVRVSPPVNVSGDASPAAIAEALRPRPAVAYYEIPPAMAMMAVGALLAYGWLRKQGVTPFDWLWAEIEKARESKAGAAGTEAAGATTGPEGVTDIGATLPPQSVFRATVTYKGKPYHFYGDDAMTVIGQAENLLFDGQPASGTIGTKCRLYYSADAVVPIDDPAKQWKLVGNGVVWG